MSYQSCTPNLFYTYLNNFYLYGLGLTQSQRSSSIFDVCDPTAGLLTDGAVALLLDLSCSGLTRWWFCIHATSIEQDHLSTQELLVHSWESHN